MQKCYLCGTEITNENKSIEHIILNSIGGRLKSSKLICKSCNSKFGNTFDSELAKQLEFFANYLDIKREEGEVQDVEMVRESTGEKYRVNSKGIPKLAKPTVQKIDNGTTTEIKIKARNIKELKQILEGYKRKNPSLNIEELLKNAHPVKEHISEPLQMTLTVGGEESMPAILKMAINYYIEKTNDTVSLQDAISDLKNNSTKRVEPILMSNSLFERNKYEITHSIFLNGSSKEKKLYAVIEFYSVIQFIIKLSDHYVGSDIQDLYVYDVLERKELKKELSYIPSYDFIFSFDFTTSQRDYRILKNKMERFMQIGAKRKNDSFISEAIEKTLNNTFKKLPKGHLITEEDTNKFVDELMRNITPLFIK